MRKILLVATCAFVLTACGGSEGFKGKYACGECLYKKLDFKESGEVEIDAGGITAKGTFEVLEKQITISTETAEYIFEIKDGNTLVGKDEAKGTYVKE